MDSTSCIEKYLSKMKKIQYKLIKTFNTEKDRELQDQGLIFNLKQ